MRSRQVRPASHLHGQGIGTVDGVALGHAFIAPGGALIGQQGAVQMRSSQSTASK